MRLTLILVLLLTSFQYASAQSGVDTIKVDNMEVDTIPQDSVRMEYFIQVASLQNAFEKFPDLKDLGYVFKIRHETKELVRYQLGIYDTRETAEKVLLIVQNRGFKDAFVIERRAYEGGP